jgi:hypothetical protein
MMNRLGIVEKERIMENKEFLEFFGEKSDKSYRYL